MIYHSISRMLAVRDGTDVHQNNYFCDLHQL